MLVSFVMLSFQQIFIQDNTDVGTYCCLLGIMQYMKCDLFSFKQTEWCVEDR